MIDFLIMYEHKNREINSDCLIKAELERRGYTVSIENTVNRQFFKYHFSKKPIVIVVMSLYNDSVFHGHVTDMVGYCRKIVNLQWEQIGDVKSRGKLLIPEGHSKNAVHICWSKKRADFLRQNGVQNAIHTGPIQMDFLKTEFSSFYKSKDEVREKYNIKESRILLYISSFSYVQMNEEDQERLTLMSGLDIATRKAEAEEAQDKTLDIIETYLLLHSNEAVIYRPHPGELIVNKLKHLDYQYQNFYIISDYSIQQWIQISDVVISWISTSISEVYFSRKKCVILQPTDAKSWDDVLYKTARISRSYDQLINEIENDQLPFPIDDQTIIDNYGSKEEGFAYLKIVDLLEKIHKTEKYDIPKYERRLYLLAPTKRLLKSVIDKLRINEKTFPFSKIPKCCNWLHFYAEYRKKTELDYVSEQEIEEITRRLERIVKTI